MRAGSMIMTVKCRTAEKLMDEMNPDRGRIWKRTRDSISAEEDWIFRGVPCASYTLTPSAFRKDAFAPFRPAQMAWALETAKEQRDEEDARLMDFCTMADRMGIHVPGDRPELRDKRRALVDYDPHEFPPIEKLHMAALAQHYGMPTRLLDWTRRARSIP